MIKARTTTATITIAIISNQSPNTPTASIPDATVSFATEPSGIVSESPIVVKISADMAIVIPTTTSKVAILPKSPTGIDLNLCFKLSNISFHHLQVFD